VLQTLLVNAVRHTPADGTVRILAFRSPDGLEVAGGHGRRDGPRGPRARVRAVLPGRPRRARAAARALVSHSPGASSNALAADLGREPTGGRPPLLGPAATLTRFPASSGSQREHWEPERRWSDRAGRCSALGRAHQENPGGPYIRTSLAVRSDAHVPAAIGSPQPRQAPARCLWRSTHLGLVAC
jgi:hypothetical protein